MNCGDPTTNLSVSKFVSASGSAPAGTSYNSAFQVRCQPGYRFSDYTAINSMTCLSDGHWNQIVVTPCIGTNFLRILFDPLILLSSTINTIQLFKSEN